MRNRAQLNRRKLNLAKDRKILQEIAEGRGWKLLGKKGDQIFYGVPRQDQPSVYLARALTQI